MSKVIPTILLCALPASGKSETRKFLRSLSSADLRENFGLGEFVDLDDYPYVHMMRQIDTVLLDNGHESVFFKALDDGFRYTADWITLMHLLNEDYDDLKKQSTLPNIESYSDFLFKRMDAARAKANITPRIQDIPSEHYEVLKKTLEDECRGQIQEKYANIPETLEGKTVVIEFARGGPDGSSYPLPENLGYENSLAALSEDILSNCAMCYIWVTPEQSRQKNAQRSSEKAGDPTTTALSLNHGVPINVLMNDYGCDDVDYLQEISEVKSALKIVKNSENFYVPIAKFDNREDKTTFVRGPKAEWAEDDVKKIRESLSDAFSRCITAYGEVHKE